MVEYVWNEGMEPLKNLLNGDTVKLTYEGNDVTYTHKSPLIGRPSKLRNLITGSSSSSSSSSTVKSKTEPKVKPKAKSKAKRNKGNACGKDIVIPSDSPHGLFEKLANPDDNGVSRVVYLSEFINEYSVLLEYAGNGFTLNRATTLLGKKYKFKHEYSSKQGNAVISVQMIGFNDTKISQYIRADIRTHYERMPNRICVFTGIRATEIDHKDGIKCGSAMIAKEQKISDFQNVCRAANEIKKELCKKCRASKIRPAAPPGHRYEFVDGNENFDEKIECRGCYWRDPVFFIEESEKKAKQEETFKIL